MAVEIIVGFIIIHIVLAVFKAKDEENKDAEYDNH